MQWSVTQEHVYAMERLCGFIVFRFFDLMITLTYVLMDNFCPCFLCVLKILNYECCETLGLIIIRELKAFLFCYYSLFSFTISIQKKIFYISYSFWCYGSNYMIFNDISQEIKICKWILIEKEIEFVFDIKRNRNVGSATFIPALSL